MMRATDRCPVDRHGDCEWPSRCGVIGFAFLCIARGGQRKDRPESEFTPLSRRPKKRTKRAK